jgi:hypothetical protein
MSLEPDSRLVALAGYRFGRQAGLRAANSNGKKIGDWVNQQIALARAETDQRISKMRAEFEQQKARLDSELAAFRQELRGGLGRDG